MLFVLHRCFKVEIHRIGMCVDIENIFEACCSRIICGEAEPE